VLGHNWLRLASHSALIIILPTVFKTKQKKKQKKIKKHQKQKTKNKKQKTKNKKQKTKKQKTKNKNKNNNKNKNPIAFLLPPSEEMSGREGIRDKKRTQDAKILEV